MAALGRKILRSISGTSVNTTDFSWIFVAEPLPAFSMGRMMKKLPPEFPMIGVCVTKSGFCAKLKGENSNSRRIVSVANERNFNNDIEVPREER